MERELGSVIYLPQATPNDRSSVLPCSWEVLGTLLDAFSQPKCISQGRSLPVPPSFSQGEPDAFNSLECHFLLPNQHLDDQRKLFHVDLNLASISAIIIAGHKGRDPVESDGNPDTIMLVIAPFTGNQVFIGKVLQDSISPIEGAGPGIVSVLKRYILVRETVMSPARTEHTASV